MPQYTLVEKDDIAFIKGNHEKSRQVIFVGQCSQFNFISAVDHWQAPIIGWANPHSHTQKFNCHKLEEQNVGVAVNFKKFNIVESIKKVLKD
jgi:hypothetical protein